MVLSLTISISAKQVRHGLVGDQIFLFGFSRGAYTVRALGGFLNKCGILKRGNAEMIPDAFAYYKKNSIKPGSADAQAWRRDHSVPSDSDNRGIVQLLESGIPSGLWASQPECLLLSIRTISFMT